MSIRSRMFWMPALAGAMLSVLVACESAYYGAMEKIGIHKRDIIVDRVKETRDSQQSAKQEFKSAMEAFAAVVRVDGGDLEKQYKRLNAELESCQQRAEEVKERVRSVRRVAEDLFDEWKAELKQYSNPELRRASEAQLRQTRDSYEPMITAMDRAARSMDPVLAVFRDQVLFLKHNLNARAVASIQNETAAIQGQVNHLIREMESSIAEADSFIRQMGSLQ